MHGCATHYAESVFTITYSLLTYFTSKTQASVQILVVRVRNIYSKYSPTLSLPLVCLFIFFIVNFKVLYQITTEFFACNSYINITLQFIFKNTENYIEVKV